MRKVSHLLAGVAALAMTTGMTTGAAEAADMYVEPVASTWTGFWIGAGAGYGFVNHELGGRAFFDDEDFTFGAKASLSGIGGEGWLGQFGAGFDFQVGDRFLIGVMGDYSVSDIKSSLSVEVGGPFPGGAFDYSLTAENMWFVGGRLGFLVNPDALVYGLVGYAHVDWKGRASLEEFECIDCGFSDSYTYSTGGLAFGVGSEIKVTDNITVKGEYRYIDLDRERILGESFSPPEEEGLELYTDSNIQTFVGSIVYRFNLDPFNN